MSPTNQHTTFKSYLTTLRIIYLAMIGSVTIFTVVSFSLLSSRQITTSNPEFTLVMRYVLFTITPLSLGAGYFAFKKFISVGSTALSLKSKLHRYQIAVILRSASMEIPGLLASVAALITGDFSFFLFSAIIIMLFILMIPGLDSIIQDLNLSQNERSRLENPDSVLE